jgi:acetolactate synthase-1/2/3 large subunit
MNGAECLLRTLVSNGLDVCFMNPGTSEMQFVAALDRVPGMRGILCLFEGVCSGAADGYARMTRRPAATLLHLGPGLANGLANFHNARKALSPVVNIVGEHSTQHLQYDAPLTSDIVTFARSVSGYVHTPGAAAELGRAASDTIQAALRPPGQVATLIVPADFSWSEAGEPGPVVKPYRRVKPDADRLRIAARVLHSGEPAALLLGGGTLIGAGLDAAGRIAAATGAKVFAARYAARMESGRGRFLPVRVPYFPEPALSAMAGLKHLILVEAKGPVSFFGYPGQPSFLAPPDCALHGLAATDEDGTAALVALAAELGAGACAYFDPKPTASATGALTPDAVGQTLASLLPEHAIVSDEMVSSGEAVWAHLVEAAPHDHLPVTGGAIGQGLPVAVGAAIACPDRKVVALEADGSGMYTLQSLWTMARESLDITVVIFANRRYRILDVEMRRTGAGGFGPKAGDMIDIGRPDLDWVRLSEGQGVPASRVSTASEFTAAFRLAMSERGPRLIEAVLSEQI